MSKKEINFDLGSRSLTAAEAAIVERAKARWIASLERHGKDAAAHLVRATPKVTVATKPAVKSASVGSDSWTSNKVAAAIRKY